MAKALTSESVKVEGLKKLRARLKKFDEVETLAAIKAANVEAGQFVVDRVKPKMFAQSAMAGNVARTLKASNLVGSAKVSMGSGAVPYAWGVEFGAKQFPQFRTWRGNGDDAGYLLFPTVRMDQQGIVDIYARALDEALRTAFPGGTAGI